MVSVIKLYQATKRERDRERERQRNSKENVCFCWKEIFILASKFNTFI